MKYLMPLYLILFTLGTTMAQESVRDTLSSETFLPKLYNHDKRVFLLFSPSKKDNRYEEQMNILLSNRDILTEAGVALYKIFPKEGLTPLNKNLATANVLKMRQQFNIEKNEFAFMYVTVNGTVQMKQKEVIDIESLLTVLDTTTYFSPAYEFKPNEYR
jgi:hypothetical protein